VTQIIQQDYSIIRRNCMWPR